MKAKELIFLFAFSLLGSTLFAQSKKFNLGVDVFPNFSSDYSDPKNSGPKPAASVGIALTYQLNKRYTFETGLKYVNRGKKEKLNAVVAKTNYVYASIPLNIRFDLMGEPNKGWYLRWGLGVDFFRLQSVEKFYTRNRRPSKSTRKVGPTPIDFTLHTGIGYSFLIEYAYIDLAYQVSIEPAFDIMIIGTISEGSPSYQSIGVKFRVMVLP